MLANKGVGRLAQLLQVIETSLTAFLKRKQFFNIVISPCIRDTFDQIIFAAKHLIVLI